MRFTSLVVELIRARPRLVVWIVVLAQAAIWLLLPLIVYGSPPGDLSTVLAFAAKYQVGTDMGRRCRSGSPTSPFAPPQPHVRRLSCWRRLCGRNLHRLLPAGAAPSSADRMPCSRSCCR